jgi:putative hydrolase of the HAD superfamily
LSRAIVFDLDDTLYRERRFALSGFAAVAREVERRSGAPASSSFAVLRRALTSGRRQRAFQDVVEHCGLPADSVTELIAVYRTHQPRLRLPLASSQVIHELRRRWKIGILTNGFPEIQARKVAALGLSDMVDAVVFGLDTGPGKPDIVAFSTVLDRLGVPAASSVFVGDDPRCDIMGARQAGMKTIRIRQGVHGRAFVAPGDEADVAVDSLTDVPAVVAGLVAPVACYVS